MFESPGASRLWHTLSDWLVPAVGIFVATFSYEISDISANYNRFMPILNLVATLSLP